MSDPQHTIIVGEAAVGAASDCGCCDDGSHGLPLLVNRPGLSAIAYRVGTHAGFKQAMLAGLSDAKRPRLAELRTRDNDDFTIALLDAWATVSDVLTFYQERIANESYLRTATERLSVVELARLIGFKPAPGVAASVALAFTMEEGAGAPDQAIKQTLIPRGTHSADRFVRPDELKTMAHAADLRATDWCGERPALLASLRRRTVAVRPHASLAVGYSAGFTKEER